MSDIIFNKSHQKTLRCIWLKYVTIKKLAYLHNIDFCKVRLSFIGIIGFTVPIFAQIQNPEILNNMKKLTIT